MAKPILTKRQMKHTYKKHSLHTSRRGGCKTPFCANLQKPGALILNQDAGVRITLDILGKTEIIKLPGTPESLN